MRYTRESTIKLDSGVIKSKAVYILTDIFCASTTEIFLLQAIQNPAVTIVGQKTRGAIDYTDIGQQHTLPCSLFYYQLPMVVSNRGANNTDLDNIGVRPKITLPVETDALQFVIDKIHE